MTNELYHHGIRGMHWGVRRYQNKDGTLTPAGQKRADKLAARYEKVTGKQVSNHATNSSSSSGKKSISEMSDDELRDRANRLNLESSYLNAQSNAISAKTRLSDMQPKHVSAGQKFLSTAVKVTGNVIKDAAEQQGKKWLNKTLGDTLGLNVEKELNKFDKAKRDADYHKNLWLKSDYERRLRENQDRMNAENNNTNNNNSGNNTPPSSPTPTSTPRPSNLSGVYRDRIVERDTDAIANRRRAMLRLRNGNRNTPNANGSNFHR